MGLLNRVFGFRWSLYVVHNGSLTYAMHEHSPIRMVGYVMSYFEGGSAPVAPWELFLNFNHKNQAFKLVPEHFTARGESVTRALIDRIEGIDPGWNVKAGEPVFEMVSTKQRLKISDSPKTWTSESIQAMIDGAGKPKEETFFSVMDKVFGKD